ncbi:hypothetical protein KJ934_00345 [Patescibacteria group bacterium]|nr:hypothetical protein [Patescibacteria group bacterium]MBU4353378.1 hypothetical protein [Patescibacteria group bacterium]MBU4477466.1 hypothetical protein [Patescibacteria group bacterium]MCG2699124.1 hypothetical protein [Candidatus Parcubacteria bacterium]
MIIRRDKVGDNYIIPVADSGLIARTSIVFEAADVLTTKKLSAAISLLNANLNQDNEIRMCIDKPTEDTAGDMTVDIYEECKVDGVNARYCKVCTLVAEKITGAPTFRSYNLSGIGYGTGNIKIGASFAVDSGAITVYFALYRK